tara:strand:+ start:1129 stop:2295 length:1167 start_codon:yes stop_codon:yes gene_type:complete
MSTIDDKIGYKVFSFRDVLMESEGTYHLSYQDPLVKEICEGLSTPEQKIEPGQVRLDQFADGTSLFTLDENVRRKDVYAIFNLDPKKDPDGELLRFMMFIKTFKKSHSGNVTAVIPNLYYSRQDQSNGKRQIITARFLADLFKFSGMDHLITIGLHSPQIEGFYDSIDHLKTRGIMSHYLRESLGTRLSDLVELDADTDEDGLKIYREGLVLVSPDAGGMRGVNELNRDFDPQKILDVGFVQKERTGINVSVSGKVVGYVEGKVAALYDDILDTGGSLAAAAAALRKEGAIYIIACIDHFLGNSKGDTSIIDKLVNSEIDELVVTNTMPGVYERIISDERLRNKVTVLSVGPLLKEAIIRDQKGYTIRDMTSHVGKENLYKVLHKAGD